MIVVTKTLLTKFYAIGSKSGLNIAKFLQDGFWERGIPINICYDNAQEEFVGSVINILHAYGLGSNQYKAHKNNHNPAKRHIQEVKVNTWTVLDHSNTPSFSWLLCMAHVAAIINCMLHRSLSRRASHKAAYSFTPDVAHLFEF